MPVFSAPRHGVSLSDAAKRAAAIAPLGRTMLSTFEFYHPIGTPEGAIYVVNNKVNFTATKEADATRDPGADIEFIAIDIVDQRPEESDAAAKPEIQFAVGNVSGLLSDATRRARGSLVPWELIERVYAADDTSGPSQLPPLALLVSNIDVIATVATLTASFGDDANVSVPSTYLRRRDYPGLVR